MLKGYAKTYDGSYYYRLVPSTKWFSKITNHNTFSYVVVLIFVAIGALIGGPMWRYVHWIPGVSIVATTALIIFSIIYRYYNAKKFHWGYVSEISKLESAYHSMSKNDQKRFRCYLENAYADEDILRDATQLFVKYECALSDNLKLNAIAEEIKLELRSKERADEIYNHSLGKDQYAN